MTDHPPPRRAIVACAAAAMVVAAGSAFLFLHDASRVPDLMLEAGRDSEHSMVRFLFPLLTGVGAVSAGCWAAAAVGLSLGFGWVPAAMGGGLVAGMVSGFMPIPPTASAGALPSTAFSILLPSLLAFGFVGRAQGWSRPTIAWAITGAFAAQFAFMGGVASTHRLMDGQAGVYVPGRWLHWLAMLGWSTFVMASLSRRPWALSVGMGASFLAVLVGTPTAVLDSFALGRFSMFAVSPIFSAVVGVLLVRRWRTKKLVG